MRARTSCFVIASLIAAGTLAHAGGSNPPVSVKDRIHVLAAGTDRKEDFGNRPAGKVVAPATPSSIASTQLFVPEVEPNNSAAQATPLSGTNLAILGNMFPVGDQDYYSFPALAGDKVFANTMTAFSSTGGSHDTVLDVLMPDGVTIIERDDDNGSLNDLSSSLAGTTIPADGTYYVRVLAYNAVRPIMPYHLHFRLQSGLAVLETEPNDTTATANTLPPNGYVAGTVLTAGDVDVYTLNLNAGDTVILNLDLDPERDQVKFNGRLGFGPFGGQFIGVNDAGITDPIPSEAFAITVRNTGTFYAFVDAASGAGAGATYELSVSVQPGADTCTLYTSVDVPKAIPDDGNITSTLTVPAGVTAADVSVLVTLDHTNMPDLDVNLISPANNNNGLFADCGDPAFTQMDCTFGDEAGFPLDTDDGNGNHLITSPVLQDIIFQPGHDYRLHWYDGEDVSGDWTLSLTDDTVGGTGNLTAWALRICQPLPPASCPAGTNQVVVFSTDFEPNDGAFTHSGTLDEWGWGSPTSPPLDDCASGVNCWKTDLTGTYEPSSSQDLVSPALDLTGLINARATWAQKYRMEGASFDHAWVEVREVGGANPKKLWEFMDGTMKTTQGTTLIQESAGWGVFNGDLSAYSGKVVELVFHLDSDSIQSFEGFAIDDVTVTACTCPTITLSPATLPNATVGQAYSQTITASGGQPPYTFAVTAGTLPSGITLGVGGVLGGTSTVVGTFNFTVTATDANGCSGSQAYSLTVVCGTIVVSPVTLADGIVGVPYNQQLTASGGTAPYVFAVSGGTLPAGLTMSAAGLISGTPTQRGVFTFTAQATDSIGCVGTQSYDLRVKEVDYLCGSGLGDPNPNQVRVYAEDGTLTLVDFFAYGAGHWGTNVASGNINGGIPSEIVTGPGPGDTLGPQVRAFDRLGASINKVNFFAYGTLKFGVNVGSQELDNDGFYEILTGPGPGPVFGPQVRGWNYDNVGITPVAKVSFFAYSTLKYGVNVSGGNLDADAFHEILTGPGPGQAFSPQVRGFNYDNISIGSINKINFNAFSTLQFGVNLKGANVDADNFVEILCTPGPGPNASFPSRFVGYNYDGTTIASLSAFDVTAFTTLYGGRVGSGDVNEDGAEEMMCGAGRDPAADATVEAYHYVVSPAALNQLTPSFNAFSAQTYGVNVTGAALGY